MHSLTMEHDTEKWFFSQDLATEVIEEFCCVVRQNAPQHVCEDDKATWIATMLQPLRHRRNVLQRLQYTIKTHKPPGRVILRAIHSSFGTPFQAAIRMVAELLRPALNRIRHLMKDSHSVVNRLKVLSVPEDAFFIPH